MIWYFPVNLFQNTFVQHTAVEPDDENLQFCHILASGQIDSSGGNLVLPVDYLDLIHKALLQRRCDLQILVELLLWDALVELCRPW